MRRQGMIAAQGLLPAAASAMPAHVPAAIQSVTSSRLNPWRTAFVASVVLHAALAAWALLGLPGATTLHKSDDGAIAVEIAPAPAALIAPPRQQSPWTRARPFARTAAAGTAAQDAAAAQDALPARSARGNPAGGRPRGQAPPPHAT